MAGTSKTIRRCDKVLLQCIVTTYDNENFPIGEAVNEAQAIMLRGNSLDAMVAKLNASLAKPPKPKPTPRTGRSPAPPKRTRKKRR